MSVCLAVVMLLIVVPYQPVLAGMIGTETVLEAARGDEARDCVRSFLARGDVQTVLMAQGIDPLEAKARVDSLSDAEVVRLAEQIEQLPAGANGGVDVVTIVIVAAFIVCITLFIIGLIEMLW
ncbi:MAG: PA2779 family protein [Deltaproteobacteria bacterium]|nr:PA2779 family protein [Deltaproteobacteria bacterium]